MNYIKLIKAYLKLSFKKKILALTIFFIMGIMRVCIVFIPFKVLASFMGKQVHESDYEIKIEKLRYAHIVGLYVNLVSKYTPWKSECFVRALSAQIILRMLRISNTLYLGIAKENGNLIAHAWLRVGNSIITGGDVCEKYKVVAKFAVN